MDNGPEIPPPEGYCFCIGFYPPIFQRKWGEVVVGGRGRIGRTGKKEKDADCGIL